MLNSSRKALAPVLKPISAALYSTRPQDPGRFRFAAAASDATNLYRAIGECVQQVHEALGSQCPPSLLQLFVTTAHRSRLAHAPECTLRKLKECNDAPPPLLIGGALQAVSGPSGLLIPAGVLGASLLACHFPGVQLWPFHTEYTSLPQLTPQAWKALLKTTTTTTTNAAAANQHGVSGASAASNPSSSSSSTSGAIQQQPQAPPPPPAAAAAGGGTSGVLPCIRQSSGVGCLLLSSPQFLGVEQLLQRLTSLLPHVPVMGGVAEPDAWVDTEHNFGAPFIRDKVVCTGAVGTFLRGPLTLTQLTTRSYRPVGSPAVVTSAAGNLILGLDGAPVHEVFPQIYGQLAEGERQAEVALGVEVMGSPGEWVTRGVSLTMGPDGRPVLAVAEVPPGVAVQLQVRDPAYQQQQWQAGVQALAEAGILPPPATAAAGRDFGGTATADTAPAAAATGHTDIGRGAGAAAGDSAGFDVAALDFTCVALQQREVEGKEAAAAAGTGGGGGGGAGGGGSQCLQGVALAGGRMQGELGRISSSSWTAPGSAAAAQGEVDKTAGAAQQQLKQQKQHQGGGWLHSFASSLSLLAYDPHWPGE